MYLYTTKADCVGLLVYQLETGTVKNGCPYRTALVVVLYCIIDVAGQNLNIIHIKLQKLIGGGFIWLYGEFTSLNVGHHLIYNVA